MKELKGILLGIIHLFISHMEGEHTSEYGPVLHSEHVITKELRIIKEKVKNL